MRRSTAELHRRTAETCLEAALALESLRGEALEDVQRAFARAGTEIEVDGLGVVPVPLRSPGAIAARLKTRAGDHLRHLGAATVEGKPALEAVPWRRGAPALVREVKPDGRLELRAVRHAGGY